ncbi:MAG: DUF642 domain-containing protein [Alphaproteobacteria bacterium]|nr:MAG: DUF642 domain-containing protein [Alphaproteobacteria bacterium]
MECCGTVASAITCWKERQMGFMRTAIISATMVIGLSAGAQAAVIFMDDFNAENGGTGALNYAGFANWTVSGGTVDLIGNGFFDFQPGNGLYVDMDGSTSNAGKIETSASFNLIPGTLYELSFDLAGNHRNAAQESVTVEVGAGSVLSEIFSLGQNVAFTTFTRQFSVGAATSVTISFEGAGGDNIGMLLDNVVLSSVDVPEPATLGLLGVGLLAAPLLRRRMRR